MGAPGFGLAKDALARAERRDGAAPQHDRSAARAVRDLDLVEVDLDAGNIGEREVDPAEASAPEGGDDLVDGEGAAVPIGDLRRFVADDRAEATHEGRPHGEAGDDGELETPRDHLGPG